MLAAVGCLHIASMQELSKIEAGVEPRPHQVQSMLIACFLNVLASSNSTFVVAFLATTDLYTSAAHVALVGRCRTFFVAQK